MQKKGGGTKRKESRENGKTFIIFFFFVFVSTEKNEKPRKMETRNKKLKIFEEVEIICVILCMKCIEKVFLVLESHFVAHYL